MLPGIALIVPLYLTIRTYGLLDHIAALVITYASTPSALRVLHHVHELAAVGNVFRELQLRRDLSVRRERIQRAR